MKIDSQVKSIVIYRQANSLYSLIADGEYRSTSLGRNTWKELIGIQASLQNNCNREGFNSVTSSSRARIGIISNNENDCKTCDSRIGFGTAGHPDDSNTCGNVAKYGGDNGDKHIKAMGYILVQWESNKLVPLQFTPDDDQMDFTTLIEIVDLQAFFRPERFVEIQLNKCIAQNKHFLSVLLCRFMLHPWPHVRRTIQ